MQFNVQTWLNEYAQEPLNVEISRPKQINVWTKADGVINIGDTSGCGGCRSPASHVDTSETSSGSSGYYLPRQLHWNVVINTLKTYCCTIADVAMSSCCPAQLAGLLNYNTPITPKDLNDGYPDQYTRKDESESALVDPIVQAATRAGVDWSKVVYLLHSGSAAGTAVGLST